jgi:hypothetical protein
MNAIPCYHLTEAAQLNGHQMSNVEQGISNDEV